MTKQDALEKCNEISRLTKEFGDEEDCRNKMRLIDDLSAEIHDFIQDNAEEDN